MYDYVPHFTLFSEDMGNIGMVESCTRCTRRDRWYTTSCASRYPPLSLLLFVLKIIARSEVADATQTLDVLTVHIATEHHYTSLGE